jgi:hypothetical protein
MTSLVHQRCLHHADREAVARCPECKKFFCRECISEHDGRILCASCLVRLSASPQRRKRSFEGVFLILQSALAVVIIWFFFFEIGRTLLSIPAAFHEGRIWQIYESE